MNGSSSGDSTVFPNSVQFNCDPGFVLSGSSKRMCRPNGTWSGFVTICTGRFQRQTANIPCFRNAFKFWSPTLSLAPFHRNTITNINQHCCPHLFPAKDCGPLAVPTNGSSTGDLTIFPNKIIFGCDEGFNLRGSRTRHCQTNGTWSGNQTLCQGCLMFYFLSFSCVAITFLFNK